MEKEASKWKFVPNPIIDEASTFCIRKIMFMLFDKAAKQKDRLMTIKIGHGDPSSFSCFQVNKEAEDAIVSAVRSGEFNGYVPGSGVFSSRCAIADHLNKDLPYRLSPNNVYVTAGCTQAIETILSVLAHPNANVLFPRPGFPFYEARAAFNKLECRHFNLDPENGWEVDLAHVEELADRNTVAMVVINPGNPCGSVYSYQHLSKIAEMAKKLGIMVIADEVYGHLSFGENPFVPMGVFANTVPVITLGSISKRWIVPGWRLGWMVTNDPNGILKDTKIVQGIEHFLNISTDPATFIQGAIPHILQDTKDDFFDRILDLLREAADIMYDKLDKIDCITCPHKPEGSMFVMVKLDLSYLADITDCVDFCCKLAEEESVIILPGIAVGMKNWLRITFAVDPSALSEGLDRLASFCLRHAIKTGN